MSGRTSPPHGSQYAVCKNCNKLLTWVPYDSGYWMHHDPNRGQFWGCNRAGSQRAEYGGPLRPAAEEGTQKRLI